MPRFADVEIVDDYDAYIQEQEERQMRRSDRRRQKPASIALEADPEPAGSDGFDPSFTGSRHEREWIKTYLKPFFDDYLIFDVLKQVKGGKEATVYCCSATEPTGYELLAAKVYRPRMFRNLRNDAQYREGRALLSDEGKPLRARREMLAMSKGTRFGKELSHASWLAHEFGTLQLLHDAGADVPKPISMTENAILMEYVGDRDGAAPTLNGVDLEPSEAKLLFERVMRTVEIMLAHDRIHGDLSAYNILYRDGAVTVIDFPQVVNAYTNRAAEDLFRRDVVRVCQYFDRYGIHEDPQRLATALWRAHVPQERFEARVDRSEKL